MAETHFIQLCTILDTLLGPEGCPWDQKQTLQSLKEYVLEETCELIDAIEENDSDEMKEELGDLFFNVVFLAKVATKEGHFTLEETLQTISDKLIRRHPHIFAGGEKLNTPDEVLAQWEVIKKQEKSEGKKSIGGIPKSLPALSRAKKLLSKMKKAKFEAKFVDNFVDKNKPEGDEIGIELFELVEKAVKLGIDPELALRKVVQAKERHFLEHCKQSESLT